MNTLAIENENLRRRAYGVIRKALMTGRFEPGQRLLLKDLANELGISITPVREALLQLVSEHALTSDSSRSLFVPLLNIERFREIRDLRIEFEGKLAEAAAMNATQADTDELERIHQSLARHRKAGEYQEALGCNEAFHFRIYRLAGMPVLYDIVEGLWVQIGPIFNRLFERINPKDVSNHPHLDMIAALKRRDGSAARRAVASDITWASRHLEDHLKGTPAEPKDASRQSAPRGADRRLQDTPSKRMKQPPKPARPAARKK